MRLKLYSFAVFKDDACNEEDKIKVLHYFTVELRIFVKPVVAYRFVGGKYISLIFKD